MKTIPVRGSNQVILVDDEDEHLFLKRGGGYRGVYVQARHILMTQPGGTTSVGRVILGLEKGDPLQADHRNHNVLDNRRANLRAVTPSQNQQNRRGVQVNCRSGVRNVERLDGRFRGWRLTVQGGSGRYFSERLFTLEEVELEALRERLGLYTHSDGR